MPLKKFLEMATIKLFEQALIVIVLVILFVYSEYNRRADVIRLEACRQELVQHLKASAEAKELQTEAIHKNTVITERLVNVLKDEL